jgi:hypothetical protein
MRALQLTEKFGPQEIYDFRGRVPSGRSGQGTRFRNTAITGEEIGGWYKNRIRWPSAIRVDDPVYIQNDLAQVTSDPPAKSLYTSMEDRGIEDVEAEMQRIGNELEDPRLHPDRLQAGIDAMGGAASAAPAPGPGMGEGGDLAGAMASTGAPYAAEMA